MSDVPPLRGERMADDGDMTNWVVAGLAALVVAGVMIFAFGSDRTTNTAMNDTSRPAATSTTGSGPASLPPASR